MTLFSLAHRQTLIEQLRYIDRRLLLLSAENSTPSPRATVSSAGRRFGRCMPRVPCLHSSQSKPLPVKRFAGTASSEFGGRAAAYGDDRPRPRRHRVSGAHRVESNNMPACRLAAAVWQPNAPFGPLDCCLCRCRPASRVHGTGLPWPVSCVMCQSYVQRRLSPSLFVVSLRRSSSGGLNCLRWFVRSSAALSVGRSVGVASLWSGR